jgi:hypothetical protein
MFKFLKAVLAMVVAGFFMSCGNLGVKASEAGAKAKALRTPQ